MFEICALLAPKKTAKARKLAASRIRPGCKVTVHTPDAVVVARDPKYNDAWTVRFDATGKEASFSRDMIAVC